MKELELTLVVRNNRLKERREALGLSRKALAEKVGISSVEYGRLEALKDPAFKEDRTGRWQYLNGWCSAAKKLAVFYKVPCEELFPPAALAIENPEASVLIDGEELLSLADPGLLGLPGGRSPEEAEGIDVAGREFTPDQIETALKALTPREEYVLRHRFGFDSEEQTLSEVGGALPRHDREGVGLCVETVRQIESKALRKLRRRLRHRFRIVGTVTCDNCASYPNVCVCGVYRHDHDLRHPFVQKVCTCSASEPETDPDPPAATTCLVPSSPLASGTLRRWPNEVLNWCDEEPEVVLEDVEDDLHLRKGNK